MYSLWWLNHIVPAHVSKVVKNFACCVWKHSKCAQVSYIMMIWDMGTSNTLTHNHNYLMETITLEVHHNTPTSPRNTLTTIFKSILILFSFIFFVYFLFEHTMHGYIRDKRNTQLCKPKHHNFAILKHIDVIHDWWVLVVRWLFMPFS